MRRAMLIALAAVALIPLLTPAPASAFNPLGPACHVARWVNGLVGKACAVGQHGVGTLAGALGGGGSPGAGVGGLVGDAVGLGARIGATTALSVMGQWVLSGAAAALRQIAQMVDGAISPHLSAPWFSATYWRMTGIAAMLTLPFLFACAIQCVVRSQLAPLLQAAFGYLPMAMLACSIAAPVTMLLLAATDELCAITAHSSGDALSHLLGEAAAGAGGLSAVGGSPFLALFIGLFTVAAALALWIELLLRSAAVYVVVLMLPVMFAALVWPARRIWAVRAIELLMALILSKFLIVAVLTLGGAALSTTAGGGSVSGLMAGAVLILLAAFSPWAVLKLLPHAELAAGAVGSLGAPLAAGRDAVAGSLGRAATVDESISPRAWAASRREAWEEGGYADSVAEIASRLSSRFGGADRPAASSRPVDSASDGSSPPAEAPVGPPAVEASSANVAAEASNANAAAEPLAAPERIPGMEPQYQQPNGSWEPIEFFYPGPPRATPTPPGEATEDDHDR